MIIILILLAVLIRLPYISLPYMISFRGDTATLGLMAMDISRGVFHTFFYGQAFMGPLETYIVAPLVRFFGTSNYVFFTGAMLIYVIFLISAYLLAYEYGGKKIGFFALLYCVIPPFWLYQHSIQLHGYHITVLILCNIILLMTLKIVKRQGRYLFYCILGLAAGLGFWNHYSIIYYIIPIGLFLFFKKKFIQSLICIPFFILGSLPWWLYNIRYGFRSLNLYDGHPCFWFDVGASYWWVFKKFITFHIFGILGIDPGHITGWILLLFYAVSVVYLIYRKNGWLFFLYIITITFISVKNKYFIWYDDGDYRHVLTLFSMVPLAVAVISDKLKRGGVVFIAIILVINGWHIKEGFMKEKERIAARYEGYSDLIQFFTKNGITGFIGDFILTQDINFMTRSRRESGSRLLSGKKIVGSELSNQRSPTDIEVDTKDRIAFLDCREFIPDINRLCYSWRVKNMSGHHVLYGFIPYEYYGRALDRTNWKTESNCNSHLTGYAWDGNMDRYWTVDSKKQAGVYFQIDLGNIYKVYKIEVFNKKPFYWNNPYGYKIEVSLDGIKWQEVDRFNKQPQPIFWSGPRLYWDFQSGRWQEIFMPTDARFLRITQLGHGRYNWIIDEIFVYEYLGERDFRLRDYVKDAKRIYKSLLEKDTRFIYADHWLSNKIRDWSGGRIGTLVRYNECWPDRDNTSRVKGNLYWTGIGWQRINTRRHKLNPSIKMDIEFTNGIKFKGYTIRRIGKRCQINYFWELPRDIKDYIVVFVYFIKDGKIVFQNDHPLSGQEGLLLERYWINLPESGKYKIELGLYLPDKNNKRLGVKGRGLYKPTKVGIGELEVK